MAGNGDDAAAPGQAAAGPDLGEAPVDSDPGVPGRAVEPAATPGAARRLLRKWPLALPLVALALIVGFAVDAELARRRRAEAIAALESIGDVSFGEPRPPGWFSRLLGRRARSDAPVISVELRGDSATDAALAYVGRVGEVRRLGVSGSGVTDASLAHIRGLSGLSILKLGGTRVTDAGLADVSRLSELRWLDLSGTSLTDGGLAHIGGLGRLRWLDLSGTGVTDPGLAHLAGLAGLVRLDLSGTGVTAAGVAGLRRRLPNATIVRP